MENRGPEQLKRSAGLGRQHSVDGSAQRTDPADPGIAGPGESGAVGLSAVSAAAGSPWRILIDLTAAGAKVVRQVTAHRRRDIARIVARMNAGTRQGLIDALTAFTEAGGEPPAGDHLDAAWI